MNYYIERKIGINGNWEALATDYDFLYEDTNNLVNNTEYYYRIRKYQNETWSEYSNEVIITYSTGTPSNRILVAIQVAETHVNLTWT